jgi:hypothetical protein
MPSWRSRGNGMTRAGEDKSGLALLVQKSSVLTPAAMEIR